MIQTLYKKLGIAAHEQSRVQTAWGLRFLYQIGFVVAWTIITALFVEKFGAKNLPLLFLVDAAIFLFGTLVISPFSRKIISSHWFMQSMLLLTILFIAVAMQFQKVDIWFFVFAILAKDLFFSRVDMGLLRSIEELFSPSEAQKTIPVVDSAITVGTIAGAFFMIQFLKYFSEELALLLWGGAAAGIWVLITLMPKLLNTIPQLEGRKEVVRDTNNEICNAWKYIKKRPFLKNLIFLVFFQAAVFTFIEVEFTSHLHEEIMKEAGIHEDNSSQGVHLQASLFSEVKQNVVEFGTQAQETARAVSGELITHKKLAHDLGMFHLIFGLLALCVQLMLTSRILDKLGVVSSMISYAALLFCSILGFFLGYWNINFLWGIKHGFHSIGTSAYHLSFYSLYSGGREGVRLFFEELLVPLGVIFAAGLLLFLDSSLVTMVILGATFFAIVAGVLMKRNFTAHSVDNMSFEENISAKLHHIEILGQRGHHKSSLVLSRELKKKDTPTIVQEKIISTLSRLDDPEIVTVYSELLNDKVHSLEVKKDILKSLLKIKSLRGYWQDHAFGQYHLLETLNHLFNSFEDSHLKKLVIMNLFQHLPPHEIVPFFLREIKKDDELLQSILLRSCAIFDDPATIFYLKSFLNSHSPRLKGAAIISLWKFKDKNKLRDILRQLLANPAEDFKISAIYGIGEVQDQEMREELAQMLGTRISSKVRLHTLIALAKLSDSRSISGLLEIIFGKNKDLAQAAFYMLDRVPADMRHTLQKEIQLGVSNRVFAILKSRQVFALEHLARLPKHMIFQLKMLYRLAERYDDILIIDQAMERG